MIVNGHGRRIPATGSNPCAVCTTGTKGCSRDEDGFFMCRGQAGQVSGFVYLGKAKGDEAFSLYRVEDDPVLEERNRHRREDGQHNGHGHHRDSPAIDWTDKARELAETLTPELRAELADSLGLAETTMAALPLLGWHESELAWTLPEVDGAGNIIGLSRRFRDGSKRAMPGSARGLTLPDSWDRGEGPVYLVEGASDTLTLHAMGLSAIGRPSNTGGCEHLARLLRGLPLDREIIVVGEYDPKPDGSWPGLDGAKRTAVKLTVAMSRPVSWCLPPEGAKDSRTWARTKITDRDDMDEWDDRGREFVHGCKIQKLQKEQEQEEQRLEPLCAVPFQELITAYPTMRPVVVDGLLRRGETMNVIAAPKVGKSWLTLGLAFAVAAGRPWLGQATTRGRVLLIDNELHPETISSRLRRMAECYGQLDDPESLVDVVSLRGRLQDLHALGRFLRGIEPGLYTLSIIDAFYRTLPEGLDENDNAAVAGLYNSLDAIADHLGCGFALVHHASKGNQSGKGITDVGSGAGSQSRAADTHVILRPHEEEKVVVMEAVVRSFPAPPPRCLRWSFPLFTVTGEFDPKDLQQPGKKQRKSTPSAEPQKPAEPEPPKADPWTSRRFVDEFVRDEPRPRLVILEEAAVAGLSTRMAERLLQTAIEGEIAFEQRAPERGQKCLISKVPFAAEKPRKKPPRKAKRGLRRARTHISPPHPPGSEGAPGGG